MASRKSSLEDGSRRAWLTNFGPPQVTIIATARFKIEWCIPTIRSTMKQPYQNRSTLFAWLIGIVRSDPTADWTNGVSWDFVKGYQVGPQRHLDLKCLAGSTGYPAPGLDGLESNCEYQGHHRAFALYCLVSQSDLTAWCDGIGMICISQLFYNCSGDVF